MYKSKSRFNPDKIVSKKTLQTQMSFYTTDSVLTPDTIFQTPGAPYQILNFITS